MPAPEAFGIPARTASESNQAQSYQVDPATIRLQGTQTLYRTDSQGKIARQRRESFGAGRIFGVHEQPQTISQRQYVQLTSGRFAGWWVAATSWSPSSVALKPPVDVRLAAQKHLGVRLYADAKVRTRLPITFATASIFQADRRANVSGRTFYRLSTGPLTGRWVSKRGLTVVGPSSADDPSSPPLLQTTVTWRALALVYRETDLSYTRSDGSQYRLKARMSDSMHSLALDTLDRTRRSVGSWSDGLGAMSLDVVNVPHALTSLDRFNAGYWAGPRSVEADINRYAPTGKYDSIFVVWQAKDDSGEQVPVGGWGLTLPPGSWANGAGFSSVITPTWEWWWTNSAVPQEVFVHEWMHQVIFFHENAGRLNLDLHAGESYGYKAENGTWKRWLSDVMRGRVPAGNGFTGIKPALWQAGTPRQP